MNRKVHFPGNGTFWFLQDEDGSGPLAPLEHCDDNGNIASLHVAAVADSYAHVFADGTIKRYGDPIGRVEQLEDAR